MKIIKSSHTIFLILLIALADIALLSAVAWAKTTELPKPIGRYAVGYRSFEFRDDSRDQPHVEGQHPRILPAHVFYPAHAGADAVPRTYLPKDSAAMQIASLARNFDIDPAALEPLGTARAHSVPNAPAITGAGRFPVVIFSHGLPLYPLQSTALLEDIASHGYVVVSVAHPGDAVDLRLADGRVIPTLISSEKGFQAAKHKLWSAPTFDERTAAIPEFIAELAKTELGRSTVSWRRDMIFVADAIGEGHIPKAAGDAFVRADRKNLALTGMSFGGNISAGTCRLTRYCRAAINLDGGQYDVGMFNTSAERPLLMLSSDWIGLPRPDAPLYPDYTVTDLAFEPWATSGGDPDIVRVRMKGMRHMGLSDLMLLMVDPGRVDTVGTAEPVGSMRALDDLCIAFLNSYLKGQGRGRIADALEKHDLFVPRKPVALREWAIGRGGPSSTMQR